MVTHPEALNAGSPITSRMAALSGTQPYEVVPASYGPKLLPS
jgi:hypothetical protein